MITMYAFNFRCRRAIQLMIAFLIFTAFAPEAFAQEPTIPTVSITAAQADCDEIDLTFVAGNGNRRIVIASAAAPVSSLPVDGTHYMAGNVYGTGANLGSNNYVVYNGTGTSITVTGLDGGVVYHFAAFEYNGFGASANYLTTGYPEDNETAPGITISISASSTVLCAGESSDLQASGGALFYTWSPSTGLSSTFGPQVTATPATSTEYTVNGSTLGGCSDQKKVNITVHQLPNVTLGSFASVCENASSITLTGGSPAGGTYSGNGVSGGSFDPSAAGQGSHTITYTYTNLQGCSNSDDNFITVLDTPNVSFSNLSDVCSNQAAFALTGGSPQGGTYSGPGVSAGMFNPANAGAGSHTLTYSYTDGQSCTSVTTEQITVHQAPSVTFNAIANTCIDDDEFHLTGGLPAGGIYSGTGVSNGEFNPSDAGTGSHVITYTYTDQNGCSGTATDSIQVNPQPVVTFSSIPPVCVNTGPVNLNTGSPAGGVYSGTGVGGNTFFTGIAGVGTHTLTYTYTAGSGCSNAATRSIVVNDVPQVSLGPDTTVCADVDVVLTPGTGYSSYGWSTGSTSSSLTVDTTGRGTGTFLFFVAVTNSAGCANRDTILVTFDICAMMSENIMRNFHVYPNPFTETFFIDANENSEVIITDIGGRVIMREQVVGGMNSFGAELPAGTYILTLLTDEGRGQLLLVKNR